MDMHHRTDIYTAYKIIKSRQIWSKDGDGQANFHTQKHGGGSDCKDEITLNFRWDGRHDQRAPVSWPGSANTLFYVPWEGNNQLLWSLTLFPSTDTNLYLTGYSDAEIPEDDETEHKEYLLGLIESELNSDIPVSIPYDSKKRTTAVPNLPILLRIARIWR